MADEKHLPPEHRADLDAMEARHARRRRRDEAALDVPETWADFPAELRSIFSDAGLGDADRETDGLDAARLWVHLYNTAPRPCSLDFVLDQARLLDLDAATVGRALDALQRAEMVTGTPEALTVVNPAVPF